MLREPIINGPETSEPNGREPAFPRRRGRTRSVPAALREAAERLGLAVAVARTSRRTPDGRPAVVRLFLAMRFRGGTIAQWRRDRPRDLELIQVDPAGHEFGSNVLVDFLPILPEVLR